MTTNNQTSRESLTSYQLGMLDVAESAVTHAQGDVDLYTERLVSDARRLVEAFDTTKNIGSIHEEMGYTTAHLERAKVRLHEKKETLLMVRLTLGLSPRE